MFYFLVFKQPISKIVRFAQRKDCISYASHFHPFEYAVVYGEHIYGDFTPQDV